MPPNSSRRQTLAMLLSVLAAPALAQAPTAGEIRVYKSPTCGGCSDWIKHLEASGFAVTATNIPDSRFYRARFGMPVGSPGMDGPEYKGQVDPYDVLLVRKDGRTSVYAAYDPDRRS